MPSRKRKQRVPTAQPSQSSDLSQAPQGDLLSDLLDALHVDSSALHVFEFSAPWGVRINDFGQAFSWTIVEGSLWFKPPKGEPMALGPGDSLVLPRGTDSGDYDFKSSAEVMPFPGSELWSNARLPKFRPGARPSGVGVLQWGGGGQKTRVVSTAFAFADRLRGPLIDALPDVMVVRGNEAGSHFVDVLLRFPVGTGSDGLPGFGAIATQTARLLLLHVVRTYALSRGDELGWLRGLSDTKIAGALTCIHRESSRDWSVAELAKAAGLSRSVFAKRFQETVGESPMRYLCAWRIHLAREALATGEATVTSVAHDLGYQSEAAFRSAFRRVTGQQPREFRSGSGRSRR